MKNIFDFSLCHDFDLGLAAHRGLGDDAMTIFILADRRFGDDGELAGARIVDKIEIDPKFDNPSTNEMIAAEAMMRIAKERA